MNRPENTLPPSERRRLAREARDAFPPMGVYAIRAGDRVVVASSRNVHGAINRAQFELRRGAHRDADLQSRWNHDGPAGFSFDVLELVKERQDAAFDYAAELQALEDIHREVLASPGGPA
jgi:hypothetical protein